MPPKDKDTGKLAFAGFVADGVPKWALVLMVLFAGLVVTAGLYLTVVAKPGEQLVTLKQANDALQANIDEYGRHMGEKPESEVLLMDDVRGQLVVQSYADACLLLVRTTAKGMKSKLVSDLARGDLAELHLMPVVEAAGGSCLNPHPGQFKTWSVPQGGCAVQVWRQWPDGCTHWQYFDACSGAWGGINWTTCNH